MLDRLEDAHERLIALVEKLTDDQVREPSRLPDWCRGELLAHLSVGMRASLNGVRGAARGEVAPLYPGGDEERDRRIAAGRAWSADRHRDELREASDALLTEWRALPEEAMDREVVARVRGRVPLRDLAAQRWIDVEVHIPDLDLGVEYADWPPGFVEAVLPQGVALMSLFRSQGDHTVNGSWHLHRTDGDGEWTIHAAGADVRVEDGHVKGDCAVRGPGWALLGYFMGRDTRKALDVVGDENLAAKFKAAFPGP